MGLWNKLFGGPSTSSAPEASWHASEEDCIRDFIRDLQSTQPERVLVVGPIDALAAALAKAAQTERLAHRLLVNTEASLTWLGNAVQIVRESVGPSIIVSPYPRRANPPTINVASSTSPRQRTVVLENVSLALRESGDKVSVGIYLIGLYSSGYWKSVQESQHGHVKPLERFRMLSCKTFAAFIDAESDAIEATAPSQRPHKMLELSAAWESDPNSSVLAFEGPVLTP